MKKADNSMTLSFDGKSVNESFARVAVGAFVAQLDPTVEEISEIKTSVSEAVTNSIVHGYGGRDGIIHIKTQIFGNLVRVTVRDGGVGIEDIKKAMEPCFTTGSSDRAGMGFTVMQTFCDNLKVRSSVGKGTVVIMDKKIISRR